MSPHFEGIEVVTAECGHQDATKLIVVTGHFQLFRRPTNGQVINENLSLLNSALCHATKFAEFKISKTLDTHPDSRPKNSENQAEGTAVRPQQEQAKQGKQRRDRVKN